MKILFYQQPEDLLHLNPLNIILTLPQKKSHFHEECQCWSTCKWFNPTVKNQTFLYVRRMNIWICLCLFVLNEIIIYYSIKEDDGVVQLMSERFWQMDMNLSFSGNKWLSSWIHLLMCKLDVYIKSVTVIRTCCPGKKNHKVFHSLQQKINKIMSQTFSTMSDVCS